MAAPSSSSSSGSVPDLSRLPENWRPSSSEYTLYYHPYSQPSRAVAQTFEEGGIPCKKVVIELSKKEQKRPEYLEVINPAGQVPVIYHFDEKKFQSESAEIMKFLCKKFPEKLHSWYPADDAATTAYIDEQLKWVGTRVREVSTEYLRAVAVYKDAEKAKAKKEQVPALLTDIEDHLKQAAERHQSSEKKDDASASSSLVYLSGTKHPSLADLQLIHELNMPYSLGIIPIDASKQPLLSQWYHTMSQRPFTKKVYSASTVIAFASIILKVKGWFGKTTL